MVLVIRPYEKGDYQDVLDVCIAAFTPIHKGFEKALGRRIFDLQYADWREQYAKTLARISPRDRKTTVFVAKLDGEVAGFAFAMFDEERRCGEIGLNAVNPKRQGQGIATALYKFALEDLKCRGAEIACVGTGGDDAHAPARNAYKALGFDKAIPGVYLFKVL